MNIEKLEKVLAGESSYRLKQAKKAISQQLIENWLEAAALPLNLREKLNKECPLSINAKTFISEDKNTVKASITLKDKLKIESVLMRHSDGRNTVCVSSQVGCPLACKFCATGRAGFKRNLEPFEIVEQVLFFARYLKKAPLWVGSEGQAKKRVTNVVFMGMGEPFLNYKNVMRAVGVLNDKDGLNIGARRISISTVGIIEGIEKLSKEKLQINLAISLHAPNNILRTRLVPANKKYPIEIVLKAVDDYIKKTKRKVMFEYLLIKGVNDSGDCAVQLAKLMKKPLCFVNLILYNPTGVFKPSSYERMKSFERILKKMGVPCSQRYRFGIEIKAACGQLV